MSLDGADLPCDGARRTWGRTGQFLKRHFEWHQFRSELFVGPWGIDPGRKIKSPKTTINCGSRSSKLGHVHKTLSDEQNGYTITNVLTLFWSRCLQIRTAVRQPLAKTSQTRKQYGGLTAHACQTILSGRSEVDFLDSHWPRQVTCASCDRPGQWLVEVLPMVIKIFWTDSDKFSSEKNLSRKFFFRISRRIWGFCRELSSSLVGKFR